MINLKNIQEARENIREVVKKTPLVECDYLNNIKGAKIFFKLENLQKTGSFKIRGAVNKIKNLSEEEKRKGLIASSAGNHAQGVALGAKEAGIEATIVMPKFAPVSKVLATQSYGANVVLEGETFNDAFEHALKLQKENDNVFIHAFNDDLVISGQGTVGLEIYEDMKDIDILICPVGGGGLLAGTAVALKELKPDIKIIGVQSENIPSMKEALNLGSPTLVKGPATIADGIAVGKVGEKTHEIFKNFVDDVVLVSEDEIAEAILFLLENVKVVSEGAGASAFAAVLSDKIDIKGKNVCIVVSGGNIDVTNLEKIVNKAQINRKRRVKLDVLVKDNVGELSYITGIISKNKANILYINQSRYSKQLEISQQFLEVVIECTNSIQLENLLQDLEKNNIKFNIV